MVRQVRAGAGWRATSSKIGNPFIKHIRIRIKIGNNLIDPREEYDLMEMFVEIVTRCHVWISRWREMLQEIH